MPKALKRISLGPNTNLVDIVEAVHSDKTPRIIERAGEALAVVVSPEEYDIAVIVPTEEGISRAIKAAGAWKDLDTDAMLERIYRARNDAPPSKPVNLWRRHAVVRCEEPWRLEESSLLPLSWMGSP